MKKMVVPLLVIIVALLGFIAYRLTSPEAIAQKRAEVAEVQIENHETCVAKLQVLKDSAEYYWGQWVELGDSLKQALEGVSIYTEEHAELASRRAKMLKAEEDVKAKYRQGVMDCAARYLSN